MHKYLVVIPMNVTRYKDLIKITNLAYSNNVSWTVDWHSEEKMKSATSLLFELEGNEEDIDSFLEDLHIDYDIVRKRELESFEVWSN